ncbi:tRNA modification GTPase [Flammeovirgaceae bacterium 311]|nr:tRNA modification GTPase [Flammeovirgaceae bacterium 311]
MKKLIFFSLFTLFTFPALAQIRYEKGYFIDSTGHRTECLIKNVDWKNNPKEIEYKLSEQAESSTATVANITEFGIDNTSKYIAENVSIDRSGNSRTKLINDRNLNFVEEKLFLKVLIEGTASLYHYEDKELERFFYRTKSSPLQQLVYKRYLVEDNRIAVNAGFKQQLWTDLRHPEVDLHQLETLGYNKQHLSRYFLSYNNSKGQTSVSYDTKSKADLFNLKIVPGTEYTFLSMSNPYSTFRNGEYENINYRIGLEAEVIMPFNNGKWALFIEPTFQHFSGKNQLKQREASIAYKSIEVPLAVRHYFFLNQQSRIFLNAGYIWDFPIASTIDYRIGNDLEISSGSNFMGGAGISYRKLSLEFRYQTGRNIVNDYNSWNANINKYSLLLAYKIL